MAPHAAILSTLTSPTEGLIRMRDLPQLSSGQGPGARRLKALACLLTLLTLLTAVPARSQDRQIRPTVEPPAAPPELETRDGSIVLSREQALEIALRRNLGLVIE